MKTTPIIRALSIAALALALILSSCGNKTEVAQNEEENVAYGIGLVQVQPQQTELDQMFERLKTDLNFCVKECSFASGSKWSDHVSYFSKWPQDSELPEILLFKDLTENNSVSFTKRSINGEDTVSATYAIHRDQNRAGPERWSYSVYISRWGNGEMASISEADFANIIFPGEMELAMKPFYDRMDQCRHEVGPISRLNNGNRELITEVMQGF